MSRIGMHPNNHLLPPVHNVGVVFLKEEFAEGEEDLHNARLALQEFEKYPGDEDVEDKLYEAMAKLEDREKNYVGFFARTFGKDSNKIIKGWREWSNNEREEEGSASGEEEETKEGQPDPQPKSAEEALAAYIAKENGDTKQTLFEKLEALDDAKENSTLDFLEEARQIHKENYYPFLLLSDYKIWKQGRGGTAEEKGNG